MGNLSIDLEDFTRIIANNPSLLVSALRTIAYQWAHGEPDPEGQDWKQTHGWFFAAQIAAAGGNEVSMGGQHIPAFLRELADRIEAGQVNLVTRLVAEQGPMIINGLGEVYEGWFENGFPQPPKLVDMATFLTMIDAWEAAGRPLDRKKYGWLADPAAVLKAAASPIDNEA